jgi:hypothetical protein
MSNTESYNSPLRIHFMYLGQITGKLSEESRWSDLEVIERNKKMYVPPQLTSIYRKN